MNAIRELCDSFCITQTNCRDVSGFLCELSRNGMREGEPRQIMLWK